MLQWSNTMTLIDVQNDSVAELRMGNKAQASEFKQRRRDKNDFNSNSKIVNTRTTTVRGKAGLYMTRWECLMNSCCKKILEETILCNEWLGGLPDAQRLVD